MHPAPQYNKTYLSLVMMHLDYTDGISVKLITIYVNIGLGLTQLSPLHSEIAGRVYYLPYAICECIKPEFVYSCIY